MVSLPLADGFDRDTFVEGFNDEHPAKRPGGEVGEVEAIACRSQRFLGRANSKDRICRGHIGTLFPKPFKQGLKMSVKKVSRKSASMSDYLPVCVFMRFLASLTKPFVLGASG